MLAALVLWAWASTALSGLALLGAWLLTPTVRNARTRSGRHRRLSPKLVFSHVGAAAFGLAVWCSFLLWGGPAAAWAGFALIIVTALIGLTMFVRWVPTYRHPEALTGGRHLALPAPTRGRHRAGPQRPERLNLPFALVLGHGVLAVGTLALMVVTIVALAEP